MGYIENLKRQWPLAADEKKWLNIINYEISELQRSLKLTYLIKDNSKLRGRILLYMKNLSEHRQKEMQKVWERRRQALMGR